jgi:hypothetical protein
VRLCKPQGHPAISGERVFFSLSPRPLTLASGCSWAEIPSFRGLEPIDRPRGASLSRPSPSRQSMGSLSCQSTYGTRQGRYNLFMTVWAFLPCGLD